MIREDTRMRRTQSEESHKHSARKNGSSYFTAGKIGHQVKIVVEDIEKIIGATYKDVVK